MSFHRQFWTVCCSLACGVAAASLAASVPPRDRVSVLNEKLRNSAASLQFTTDSGYLLAVLDALKVPVESQVLVFSSTSAHAPIISQQNPRAIFFSDDVAVGWVRGSSVLEVAAHDPQHGVNFYTLDQLPSETPQFSRNDSCLSCHVSKDMTTPKFANRTLAAIAGNWSFSRIYQLRSGAPLNVIMGSDVAMNGFQGNNGTQRPNLILASPYGDTKSLTTYLSAAAFANSAPGTYGNLGQSAVVGPAYWDWSEAVTRQFQVREGQRIEFRAEAFNVTNSLRRGNPGTTTGSANTFGRITSSAGGPRILQFAIVF